MKKKILIVLVGLIVLFTIATYTVTGNRNLVGPGFMSQATKAKPSVIPASVAAPVAPKTFNFDSSTDLKLELEKVNPQILDSDFK